MSMMMDLPSFRPLARFRASTMGQTIQRDDERPRRSLTLKTLLKAGKKRTTNDQLQCALLSKSYRSRSAF
jgi:hypothetical protein